MNRGLKWKLIAGFALVFLAGGMTGAFITASQARHFFFGHYHDATSNRIRNRLRVQLHLTDEQLAKISPIIDKTAAQLDSIRIDTGHRVRETLNKAHREMAADLTPEQQAKLQKIEARHRRWLHRGPSPTESPPSPESSPQ
jgi:Spy/CpxP family protein refolding chaperone